MSKKEFSLDPKKMPRHIAIILDGNRRWARARGLSANEGHRAGVRNLERVIDECKLLGIKYLTVYALSTENWRKRTKKEVKGIFDLIVEMFRRKKEEYKKGGVRVVILGNFQAFPRRVKRAIENMLSLVLDHERIKFNMALNYGGRDEIVRAVQKIVKEGVSADKITEQTISDRLYTNGQPDPDLIIRTGGELRLSNFLLWQMSYSELYFTNTFWPAFGRRELRKAIAEYQKRQRRYGK